MNERDNLLEDLRRSVRVIQQAFEDACRRRFLDLETEAKIEDTLKDMLKRLKNATGQS